MKGTRHFMLIIALYVFVSCDSDPSSKVEYERWFANEENGFIRKKNVGQLVYTVQLKPSELMAIKELKGHFDKGVRDSIVNSYDGSKYFMLDIRWDHDNESNQPLKGAATNYNEYKELVSKLSFDIGNYARLELGDLEIEPSIAHFERGYELANSNRFLFAFPVEQDVSELKFVFYDNYFGTGTQKFKFHINKEIPTIPSVI